MTGAAWTGAASVAKRNRARSSHPCRFIQKIRNFTVAKYDKVQIPKGPNSVYPERIIPFSV